MLKTIVALAVVSQTAAGQVGGTPYVENAIQVVALKEGVPPALLRAICVAESNLKADSFNYDDGGAVNSAFGICQILYNTAKEQGFKGDTGCKRDFRSESQQKKAGIEKPLVLSRNYQTCKLFGPKTSATYAARYLKTKLQAYDGSWINAIAAYNAGSIRVCSKKGFYLTKYDEKGRKTATYRHKKCIPGELLNRHYVDRVLKALEEYNQ